LIPDNEAWQKIRFKLFDAPGHLGTFEQRYEFLKRYCQTVAMRHIQCVEQRTVSSHKELDDYLEQITVDNAEGLMLKLKHEVY
ncbi:DNA ligase, partial [Vibrio alfacsensis]